MSAAILPVIACLSIQYALSDSVGKLRLGFVNNEVSGIEECFDQSLIFTEVHEYQCRIQKLSCMMIREFDEEEVEKVWTACLIIIL